MSARTVGALLDPNVVPALGGSRSRRAGYVRASGRGRQRGWQASVAAPAVLLLVSLSAVIYATVADVPPGAVVLATTTALVATLRLALAYRELGRVAQRRVARRADELTGLATRAGFHETLGVRLAALDGDDRLAVVILDLDRFKEINESLGHNVGDDVLRQLAARLAEVADDASAVARLGGDEFALLACPLRTDPATLAGRLSVVLVEPFLVDSMSLRLDGSLGIALAPDHGTTADLLLKGAEVAMYAAKHARCTWKLYAPHRDPHTRERLELIEDLRDAIGRGEIVAYYQPKMDLATGMLVGVEALARWSHPTHGLLTPDRFLHLVEQGGLMGPLAMCILDQALAQQARWAANGVALSVAVNLSATNLEDDQLPAKVAALLDRAQVPASGLVLEITEDSFMSDSDQARRVLTELRALGVEVSVDDYGTGFSSLAYLRDLPVNELKLDRTFLAATARDERAVTIIRSTIDLAHSLGLRIVAEGVETHDALDLIADLGCDVAQGYLIGRPMPASQVLATRTPVRPSRVVAVR